MQLQIESRRGAVRLARHWVSSQVRPSLPDDVLAVVELLTSELVGNAVLHGSGEITVEVRLTDVELTVGVRDEGPGLPVVRPRRPEVPGGHGVRLVDRMATRWGVTPHDSAGKTVWFTVELAPAGPTRR